MALAQLALFWLVPDPNAQTKSIIIPISGIMEIRIVIIQSLVDMVGACAGVAVAVVSILVGVGYVVFNLCVVFNLPVR